MYRSVVDHGIKKIYYKQVKKVMMPISVSENNITSLEQKKKLL